MKILHLADEHCRDRDIEEISRIFDFIIETAKLEGPDLIVSAGDMFHSQDIKLDSQSARAVIKFVSSLANIAPVAIVLGTKSHDGNCPEILSFAKGKFDVFVASRPVQTYLEDGFFFDRPAGDRTPDCVVTLIPQPTKQFFRSEAGIADTDQQIGKAMSALFSGFGAQAAEYNGVPHVLVYHGGISGAVMSNGQVRTGMEIEVSTDQMNLAGADLNLCGHIHKGQQLGDQTFYSGSIYAENVGEDHEHGFYFHEIESGYHGFVETPYRKVIRFKKNFTDGTSDISTLTFPQAPIGIVEFIGAFVRCEYTVWQDEANLISKEDVIEFYRGSGAAEVDVRITRVPRSNIRASTVLEAVGLPEKLVERARLVGEEVEKETLDLAGLLEGVPGEELLKSVMEGKI
jgi:DNA repair exonuclease SbcCD nuclease subunit